jgi:hypothetical protein
MDRAPLKTICQVLTNLRISLHIWAKIVPMTTAVAVMTFVTIALHSENSALTQTITERDFAQLSVAGTCYCET